MPVSRYVRACAVCRRDTREPVLPYVPRNDDGTYDRYLAHASCVGTENITAPFPGEVKKKHWRVKR